LGFGSRWSLSGSLEDALEELAQPCLHHALEFWTWSASAGKRAVLADIRTDFDEIVRNDAAQ
jgi:hypothetical protein